MYRMAKEILAAYGFDHSEISNWAKPGFVCRHNVGYWTHRQYMGFGIGAHGFVKGRRFCKTDDLEGYVGGHFACETLEEVDKDAEMAEFMMLGLRLTKGISIKEFQDRFGQSIFQVFGRQLMKFAAGGLLETDDEKIALTPRGIDISNMLFAEFL
jgi:oxygen-independent coproporphyrinogen-3 oxidase